MYRKTRVTGLAININDLTDTFCHDFVLVALTARHRYKLTQIICPRPGWRKHGFSTQATSPDRPLEPHR
jgi:hypothetical protein